ncbi:MAG: dephospho-CoA kinase [Treponema sp.]|nr:dephospho-CoA kinase [Treponema sp.]
MKEKKIIGLTGTYCAGKNHLAQILEGRGIPVLDVDLLGHRVLELEKPRIIARFGADILDSQGQIQRQRLGQKVFGRPEELSALEAIVHPRVNQETLAWIQEHSPGPCVINAALLHKSSAFEHLDGIILVEAPLLVRLLRAKRRDKLPWRALIRRFLSQKHFTPQYFKGKTDIYRVENFGYLRTGQETRQNKLEHRVDEILSLMGVSRV